MFKLFCFEESEKDDQFTLENEKEISTIKKIILNFKQKQSIYRDNSNNNNNNNNDGSILNDEITYKNRTIKPTIKEIRSLLLPKLKPIKLGEYSSVDEYLDTHFNLLREDFIHPIRETLGQLENGNSKSTSYLYTDVTFKGFQKSKYSISLVIQFNYKRVINWERFSKLLNGSLLVLSNDGFKDEIYFATVETRPLKGNDNSISISFYNDQDYCKLEYFFQNKFTMIESPTYFESIRNVLESIQSITPDELPLKKYLLQCSKETIPPKYIRDNPIINLGKTFNGSSDRFDIISSLYTDDDDVNKFPSTLITLDSSQIDAFEHALTSQLSLIQGPPGTGKSKIGIALFDLIYKHLSSIQLKLESRNRFTIDQNEAQQPNYHSPILILCYTNHALDQFLNGILKSTDNVIRIGSRSKDLNIKKFNLFDHIKKLEEDSGKRFARYERENLLVVIKSELDNISNILSFNEFKEYSVGSCIGYQNIEYDFYDEYDEEIQDKEIQDGYQGNNKNNVNISKVDWNHWINSINKKIKQDIVNTKFKCKQPPTPINTNQQQPLEEEDDEFVEELINNRRFDFDQIHENLESIDIGYIFQLLKLPDDSFEDIQQKDNINDIFDLYDDERILYYRYLLKKKINSKMSKIQELISQFKVISSKIKDYENQATRQVLLKSDVIAATITGASRMKKVFDKLSIKVVIIEEAAEVHEGHIVSVLPSTTDHLLLIGDHLQLKPSCSVYQLSKRYNLDVSLFERLLKNGSAHKQLKIQRRMVPEISQFIKPIYPDLQNHSSVIERSQQQNSSINGMSSNVYFITHEHLESSSVDNNTSKSNQFEAEFIIGLADYLIKQNHLPSDIVILTPYTGQLQLIRKLIDTNYKSKLIGDIEDYSAKQLTKVNVRTIDMFQGEERNIVLLSLVRSNENDDSGFVKIENRINVALSRAKFAMYMFGNRKLLENSNRIWKNMFKILDSTFLNNSNTDNEQEQQQTLLPLISNSIVLTCGNHLDQISNITCDNDFKSLVPEGGCLKNCNSRLSCGHKCEKLCHVFNPTHSNVPCFKLCSKVNEECGHKCLKKCNDKCDPCIEKVERIISSCNHKLILDCGTDMDTFICTKPCNKIKKCGHSCKLICGQKCDREPCHEIIEKQSLSCGHSIKKECNELNNDDNCKLICNELLACGDKCLSECIDHKFQTNDNGEKQIVHPDCSKKECKRVLICNHVCNGSHGCLSGKCGTCKHLCENQCKHSRCKEKCGKECIGCTENCGRGCEHVGFCEKLCRDPCEIAVCNEPCLKTIKACGHKCIGLCGEKCPTICRICDPDYYEPISMMKLSEFNESDCFITLHGNHTFLVENLDSFMNLKQDDGKIILKKCPSCKLVIKSKECSRYKDLINQDWDDFNKIKNLNSPLSKQERDSIVKSFGSAAGHWFKCKNSHYYYIGECGGAMEVARCIECDEKVGGTEHKLLPSNQLAGEIDGATKQLYQPLIGNF